MELARGEVKFPLYVPVIALGTALLGFGFLEYVGYKARLLP